MPDNIVTKRNTKGANTHGKLFLLTGFYGGIRFVDCHHIVQQTGIGLACGDRRAHRVGDFRVFAAMGGEPVWAQ